MPLVRISQVGIGPPSQSVSEFTLNPRVTAMSYQIQFKVRDFAISKSCKYSGQRHRPKCAWPPSPSLPFPANWTGYSWFSLSYSTVRYFHSSTKLPRPKSQHSPLCSRYASHPCSSPPFKNYSGSKNNTTQALAISRVVANSDSGKHLIFPSWGL